MKFRVPHLWIYEFAERLLKEAGVNDETIEADLESFIYEAGMRGWEDYDDNEGYAFYSIDFDLD